MDLIVDNIEEKLEECILDLNHYSRGFTAVYFNLSKLNIKIKNDLQIKIVINLMQECMKFYDGKIFRFSNYDILIIVFTGNKEVLSKVEFQTRYLFVDDPLAYLEHNKPNPQFCNTYNLTLELDKFKEDLKTKVVKSTEHMTNIEDEKNRPTILDINSLERELRALDISKYIKSQPIAIQNETGFKKMFAETFVNVELMIKDIKYDLSHKLPRKISYELIFWLLDQSMFKFLARHQKDYLANPVSLNICVNTICSNVFSDFLLEVEPEAKSKVLIEFHYSDVIYDFNAFKVAKKVLEDNNIKFCIDGLNNYTFLLFDNNITGANLMKLQWNADLASSLNNEENLKLIEKINQTDPHKMILTRCDNEKAIKYGNALGIRRFQGWYIDEILNK